MLFLIIFLGCMALCRFSAIITRQDIVVLALIIEGLTRIIPELFLADQAVLV